MEEQALAPHVLALDDDAAIRDLIADYLGANDLRVTTVASGRWSTVAAAVTLGLLLDDDDFGATA